MNRKYTRIVLSVATLGLLGVAAFNAIVDPYGIVGSPRIEGFNADKPEASQRERLSKAYEIRQVQPSAVLLGTSRAKCLDAKHPHFDGTRAYNLAISSSSVYEQWRYFEHAMAVQPLTEAVIGVDFDAFRESTTGFFSEARLVPTGGADARWAFDPNDIMSALLSLDALRSSFATIEKQERLTEPEKMVLKVRRNHGHRTMFRDSDGGEARKALNSNLGGGTGIGTAEEPGSFRKLLRLAYERDVRLHLYVSPYHARFMEAWQVAGVGPRIEEWKRTLVAVNEEEARLAGKAPFPLWDFSGYNSVTTEPIPQEGDDRTVMRGYTEGSHFRADVGRLVFDRLFGYRDMNRKLPDDFGVRLTSHNIDAHLAAVRAGHARYRAAFPQDVAEVKQEVERQQRKRGFLVADAGEAEEPE